VKSPHAITVATDTVADLVASDVRRWIPPKAASVIWLAVLCLMTNLTLAAEPTTATFKSEDPFASLFDDPVVARGKGVEVKQSQVEEAFIAFKAQMAVRNQMVPESRRAALESQLLEGLIATQILLGRATDADKDLAQERAAKNLAEFKKSAGSEDILRSQLKARGLTLEKFVTRILADETARVVVEREFETKITITDERLKDLYENGTDLKIQLMQEDLERSAKDSKTTAEQLAQLKTQIDRVRKANLARFEIAEQVRVSHILLAARNRDTDQEIPQADQKVKRELAQKLLARARAGEDFQKLVSEFSEDRNLKQSRGEYKFSRDEPFVQEFKSAAFSLEPGQISDIVTTTFGYHIIKLHERIPARKVTFDEIKKDLKDVLVEQEFQRRKPEYMDQLRKEAGVEILSTRYKLAGP
jgi:peptidyl-prolyl cis-trans isomerase C